MNTILVCDIGRTRYSEAWRLQRAIADARREDRIRDVLLLTEHEHVYTLGTSADQNHLLASGEELAQRHIDLEKVDRGGDITYHGPGQLVGYPIIDLASYYCDSHRYLRDLETVIIRSLCEFGINAGRDPEFTGVWTGENKIAAIGVKISRWITMHGFALNVSTDLSLFDRIIPCGIFHKGVTSIEQSTGKKVPLPEVAAVLVRHFGDVFRTRCKAISMKEIGELLGAGRDELICQSQ